MCFDYNIPVVCCSGVFSSVLVWSLAVGLWGHMAVVGRVVVGRGLVEGKELVIGIIQIAHLCFSITEVRSR